MKEDPETKEKYYEVKIKGTVTKKFCRYKDRDYLYYLVEREELLQSTWKR